MADNTMYLATALSRAVALVMLLVVVGFFLISAFADLPHADVILDALGPLVVGSMLLAKHIRQTQGRYIDLRLYPEVQIKAMQFREIAFVGILFGGVVLGMWAIYSGVSGSSRQLALIAAAGLMATSIVATLLGNRRADRVFAIGPTTPTANGHD